MTNKVAFFYLNGTDPLVLQFINWLGSFQNAPRLGLLTVPGLNGLNTTWPDGAPRNDPFINLLDPNIFEARKIGYPALAVPMSVSMEIGITNLVAAITNRPKGQKFMIGGYSQGAAVASSVELMLRSGGALHSAHAADYLGGVCFGNPRRQINYRGEVGGTWSGAFDVPGSSTGGHGSFPTTGPYARLTGCNATKWIELTEENDIFSSVGDSTKGLNWTSGNSAFLTLPLVDALNALANLPDILDTAFNIGGLALSYIDGVGRAFDFPGNGHAAYPWRPPPGDPDNGLTSFQIAVKWLTGKANAYAVGSDVLPAIPTSTSTAGWTTTLIPPAA